MATCRRVLENVGRLVSIPRAGEIFKVRANDRTQEQRWALISHEIKSMSSAVHHDDDTTDGFTWGRADA